MSVRQLQHHCDHNHITSVNVILHYCYRFALALDTLRKLPREYETSQLIQHACLYAFCARVDKFKCCVKAQHGNSTGCVTQREAVRTTGSKSTERMF
jgi:hypothetical protein